jgi:acyl carrier protein
MQGLTDDEVCGTVADILGVEGARCTPATPIVALVHDSFRLVEMSIEIQDRFAVILEQDDLRGLTTMSDLAVAIRRRRS